jgi:hypothetical protein
MKKLSLSLVLSIIFMPYISTAKDIYSLKEIEYKETIFISEAYKHKKEDTKEITGLMNRIIVKLVNNDGVINQKIIERIVNNLFLERLNKFTVVGCNKPKEDTKIRCYLESEKKNSYQLELDFYSDKFRNYFDWHIIPLLKEEQEWFDYIEYLFAKIYYGKYEILGKKEA